MLRLNVGFNRKVGEANYGSRGASVNLELELDSGLVEHPDRLQGRIQQLFELARSSVDTELHSTAESGDGNGRNVDHGNGNGSQCRNHGGNNGRHSRSQGGTIRRATQSQVRAIHAIAERQGLDLAERLQTDFAVDTAQQLSIAEASQLIDSLKGEGNRQPETNGVRR